MDENNENEQSLNTANMKDFKKVLLDFINDIITTFPEVKHNLDVDLSAIIENIDNEEYDNSENITNVRKHCASVYPEKFFDILYQNEEIFTTDTSLEFLPGIDFNIILKDENITDNTRKTIWKYLQLILFTVVSDISDSSSFGDTAKLFEAIDEDEFKSKLEDTINKMQETFDMSGVNMDGSGVKMDGSGVNMGGLPDPSKIHEHVAGMMDGKLGKLAHEIAEETAKDLNMNMDDSSSVQDVFQNLFQNPTKLMGLVKKVGGKLDEKIKSGEINESELLAEAGDMVKKMKDMPGMDNIQSMLGNLGKGTKMNMGAMQAEFEKKMKMAKHKERMRTKMNNTKETDGKLNIDQDAIDAANRMAASLLRSEGLTKEGIENLVYSTGETYEKSSKPDTGTTNNKKKKKKKKNKAKN
jgi:hypothetical protein